MSYEGQSWIDRELEGAIGNQETYEGVAALAATALIGAVRVSLAKLSAEVSGLVSQQSLTAGAVREQTDRLVEAVAEGLAEVAAMTHEQTLLLAKIHQVDMSDLYPQGEEMGG